MRGSYGESPGGRPAFGWFRGVARTGRRNGYFGDVPKKSVEECRDEPVRHDAQEYSSSGYTTSCQDTPVLAMPRALVPLRGTSFGKLSSELCAVKHVQRRLTNSRARGGLPFARYTAKDAARRD